MAQTSQHEPLFCVKHAGYAKQFQPSMGTFRGACCASNQAAIILETVVERVGLPDFSHRMAEYGNLFK